MPNGVFAVCAATRSPLSRVTLRRSRGQNPSLDPLDLQSLAVETLHLTDCSYSTCLRYETKFERQYDRAYSAGTRSGISSAAIRNWRMREMDLALERALAAPPPAAVEADPLNWVRTCKTHSLNTFQPKPPLPRPPTTPRPC